MTDIIQSVLLVTMILYCYELFKQEIINIKKEITELKNEKDKQ